MALPYQYQPAYPQQQMTVTPAVQFDATGYPQTGLLGSEQALQGGLSGALAGLQTGVSQAQDVLMRQANMGMGQLAQGYQGAQQYGNQALKALEAANAQAQGAISSGMGDVNKYMQEGVSALQGYTPAGMNAYNLMANLTGASGAPAQQQAFANFMDSPEVAYQKEQAQKAILQNARALGGVGGNAMLELSRDAGGRAAQSYNDYFNRLAGVSNTGFQAASGIGSLRGQQSGMLSNLAGQAASAASNYGSNQANILGQLGQGAYDLGTRGAELSTNLGSNIANLLSGAGSQAANYAYGTGQNLASGRTAAGNAIANAQLGEATDLANLYGSGASNVSNIIQGTGQDINSQQAQLAQLLAGLYGQNAQLGGTQASTAVKMEQGGYLKDMAKVMEGAATAAKAFSDERLKKNIKKLGVLKGFNIYSWEWIGKSLGNTVGVIAQEVQKVMPNAVSVHESGYLQVDYGMVLNG